MMFHRLREKLTGNTKKSAVPTPSSVEDAGDRNKEEEEAEETEETEEEEAPPPPKARSVNHFQSQDELRKALVSSNMEGSCGNVEPAWLFSQHYDVQLDLDAAMNNKNNKSSSSLLFSSTEFDTTTDMSQVDRKTDWVLENYDKASTKDQSLQHELRRLLVLRSYLVLDTERKESFDRVTGLASERFDCPIALISLIDLGRQWFLSNRGLGDARETPRKLAICAHAIMSKTNDCFVVPDATKDVRFQNNPLVTGPPNVAFYAGAPLLSPEGYKLGTLCVVDNKPRPEGLTQQDQDDLKKYAVMAVETMVEHRRTMSVWFNNLVSAQFPTLSKVPDVELTEHSGNSESSADDDDDDDESKEEEEDENVAAFLATTENMSLESLVSMLRKQAREQEHAADFLQPYAKLVGPEEFNTTTGKAKPKSSTKRVRFEEPDADDNSSYDDTVRVQVHYIESYKVWKKFLWWGPRDMQKIRADATKKVQRYRRYKRGYAKSVETVAMSSTEEAAAPSGDLENHMKRIVEHPKVRGLEMHIVDVLFDVRMDAREALLKTQEDCWAAGETDETMANRLLEQSVASSEIWKRYAAKMAQCDEIAALTC